MFDAFVRIMAGEQPGVVPVDGARLRSAGGGVWLAERELIYRSSFRLPVRTVVLEHGAGALTCYAPVQFDAGTLEAIAGLGEVRLIIAPNRFHTMFIEQACRNFPAASLIAPPSNGLKADHFGACLGIADGDFSLGRQVTGTVVRTRSGFEEIVLYHDRAELLVVSDLFFNLGARALDGRILRWLAWCNGLDGRPAQSRLQRALLLREREGLARFYHWAMGRPFAQISMAHGQLVTDGAREIFYQLFHQYAAS